jgi:hypothetical protein
MLSPGPGPVLAGLARLNLQRVLVRVTLARARPGSTQPRTSAFAAAVATAGA